METIHLTSPISTTQVPGSAEGSSAGVRPSISVSPLDPGGPEKKPLSQKVSQLERENRRLHKKLHHAGLIIEAQKNGSDPGNHQESSRKRREQMISPAQQLFPHIGKKAACVRRADGAKGHFTDSCIKQGIEPGHLTVHADRVSSEIKSSCTPARGFGCVTKTHRRPHVSNDNPYSESQFKTLKY